MTNLSEAIAEPPTRANTRLWDRSAAGELRALARLAVPLVFTQLAQMAVLTTDVVLLGHFSTQALAAAALGNTLYYLAWLAGSGPAFAVAPLVAHQLGARPRDRAGVRAVARMGLWAALLACVPLIPILLCAAPILRALGQRPDLSADAGRFVALLCLGLPFAIAQQVLRNLATALDRPHVALVVTLAAIAWNAVVGFVLVFGAFGAPRLGLIGGGLATSSSAVFGFVAMLLATWLDPKLAAYRILRRAHRAHWPKLVELLRLGAPIGMTVLFETALFNAMTLVVGRFGETAVAAHQIALNFASMAFMVPLGIGLAASVTVGRAAGAGDLAATRRAGLFAMAAAVAFAMLSAAGMILFGRAIALLYVSGRTIRDLQVAALATVFLRVAAVFQLCDGLQVVGALSLRGMKDARWPMILAGISYWLVGAPTAVVLAIPFGLRGLGVWIGLACGLAAAAILMCGRFLRLSRPPRAVPATPGSPG